MIVKKKDQLKLLCKDDDLISVIVPVYNTEKFMCRCIDSIINQTYQNLEIILVDDGSPDNAPAVCDDYKKRYLNIKVIHKANGGASSARNAGLDKCTGRFVSFIDSDDYIDKNMIKRLYTQITKCNADVAMVKYMETSNDDVLEHIEEKNSIVYVNDDIRKAFLTLKIDSVCVGLYSREVIGDSTLNKGGSFMLNFTVGPVMSSSTVRSIGAEQVPYFRTTEFSSVMLENEKYMLEYSKAPKGSRAVFMTCSSTGSMEAVVMNCFTKNDKLLVINGGSFGQRFVDLCDIHEIPHVVLKLEHGKGLTRERLYEYDNQKFTGLLVNVDETSTAVLYDTRPIMHY